MKWFKNLNATPRLMMSFGVLLVMTLGIVYLAVNSLSIANDRADSLYHSDMVGSTRADGITINVTAIRGDDLNAMYRASDPAAVAASEKDELAMMVELHANLDEADRLFVTTKGIEQLDAIRKTLPDYERAQGDLFRALKAKDITASDAALAACVQYRKVILGASDVARTLKTEHAQAGFQANLQAYQHTRNLMITAAGISLALGLILSFLIARGFAAPLGQAVVTLERVAEGDLTATLDVDTKDEVGRMAGAPCERWPIVPPMQVVPRSNWRPHPRRLPPAPSSRQPAWRRLQPAWKRLPRLCGKAPTTPNKPANSHPAPKTPRCKARKWLRRRSPQWRKSMPPRPGFPTSFRPLMKLRFRPICWR
jgi:HAMP domain-containing protein